MAPPSLVAVYGFPVIDPEARSAAPADTRQPVRLGGGRLVDERVVIFDDSLAHDLDSDDAPQVLRVGIASRLDGVPFVEVVEVRQIVHSRRSGEWAAELWTSAESPTTFETRTDGGPGGPANGWCYLFPSLSFC